MDDQEPIDGMGSVRPNGKAIRDAREAKGWKQQVLADKAKVSKRTVEKLEAEAQDSGTRVQLGTLRKIASVLGGSAADFTSEPEEDLTKRPDYGLDGSGITRCFPQLARGDFEAVLGQDAGSIVIVNTWVENLQELIEPLLNRIRRDTNATIDLYQLDPKSQAAKVRAREMPERDVVSAIRSEFGRIQTAMTKLSASERKRIRLFTLDFIPKFCLYAVGEFCFVGFFWLKVPAVSKTHLLVRGKSGYFARDIWDYLAFVRSKAKPFKN